MHASRRRPVAVPRIRSVIAAPSSAMAASTRATAGRCAPQPAERGSGQRRGTRQQAAAAATDPQTEDQPREGRRLHCRDGATAATDAKVAPSRRRPRRGRRGRQRPDDHQMASSGTATSGRARWRPRDAPMRSMARVWPCASRERQWYTTGCPPLYSRRAVNDRPPAVMSRSAFLGATDGLIRHGVRLVADARLGPVPRVAAGVGPAARARVGADGPLPPRLAERGPGQRAAGLAARRGRRAASCRDRQRQAGRPAYDEGRRRASGLASTLRRPVRPEHAGEAR